MKKTQRVFVVHDTETDTLWSSPRGKCVWHGKAHAKNGWLAAQPYRWNRDVSGRFDDQTRYVIREAEIVLV